MLAINKTKQSQRSCCRMGKGLTVGEGGGADFCDLTGEGMGKPAERMAHRLASKRCNPNSASPLPVCSVFRLYQLPRRHSLFAPALFFFAPWRLCVRFFFRWWQARLSRRPIADCRMQLLAILLFGWHQVVRLDVLSDKLQCVADHLAL